MDKDGFEAHYEVVLAGTGLVQSILSAALSKRGRRVLHLDENDYYGGDHHATHTLAQFLSLCRRRKGEGREQAGDKSETTDMTDDEVTEDVLSAFEQRGHPLSCSPSSTSWLSGLSGSSTLREGIVVVDSSDSCSMDVEEAEKSVTMIRSVRDGSPVCRGYRMEKKVKRVGGDGEAEEEKDDVSTSHPCFFGYRPDHTQTTRRLLYESRNFQIDSTPKLLLSAGKMVDAIISSGVGNYLEFKSVESIFFVSSKSPNAKKSSSTVDISSAASTLQLWTVPSCKKDIFATKMFTALEKRSLMKLMQFAVDYGREKDGLPVTTLNENELAQGRSLFRPQNKSVTVSAAKKDEEEEEKGEGEEKTSFADFLNKSTVPSRLQEFVTHALCLDARPAPLVPSSSEGLDSLYRHVNAAGRYGETSFLIPVYGTSEFAQAFCRLSAVWGGVFLLRETLSKVLTSTGSIAEPQRFKHDSPSSGDIVISSSSSTDSAPRVAAVKLTNSKYIACDHLVCDETLQFAFSTLQRAEETEGSIRFVQRQMILTSPFLAPSTTGASQEGEHGNSTRGVCVFPAQTPGLGNSHAIYLLQLDESTQVAPRGAYVAYLMTFIPSARRPYSSMRSDEEDVEKEDRSRAMKLMADTTAMLSTLISSSLSEPFMSSEEKFFATFLHPPAPVSSLSSVDAFSSAFANVHLCDNAREKVLYIHDAVCQAENIFKKMYPGDIFLEDTEENNTAQTRYIPDDDDDGLGSVLSSAQEVAASVNEVVKENAQTEKKSNEEDHDIPS